MCVSDVWDQDLEDNLDVLPQRLVLEVVCFAANSLPSPLWDRREEYIHEHGLLLFWEPRRWGKDKKEDWIEAYKNFRKCLHHKCFKNPEQQPVFLAHRGLLVLAFSASFWTLDIRKGEDQSFTILNQWLNVLSIKPGFILLMKSGRVLTPIFSLHHCW